MIWKRSTGHQSSPEWHIGLRYLVDQGKSLLSSIDAIEVQENFSLTNFVELMKGDVLVKARLNQSIVYKNAILESIDKRINDHALKNKLFAPVFRAEK